MFLSARFFKLFIMGTEREQHEFIAQERRALRRRFLCRTLLAHLVGLTTAVAILQFLTHRAS